MGERSAMITVPELAADALGTFLASYMHRRYGASETRLVELVPSIARIAMECIGNSDALYHNVEHTMLVTLAGHDILRGRALHAHIAPAVEGSRFPSSMPAEVERIDEEASLLRAADLIGQLGDPHYIRKANALYNEFEEAGLNRQLGYESPADIVHKYPQFYWNSVAPYIQSAIRYLNVTANGRQWIANLYSNVFRAERDLALGGPQK